MIAETPTAFDVNCPHPLVGHLARPFRVFNLVFALGCFILQFVCLSLWWYNRNHAYLKTRVLRAVILYNVSFTLSVFALQVYEYSFGDVSFFNHCQVFTMFLGTAINIYYLAIVFRLYELYHRHKLLDLVVQFFADGSPEPS